MSFNAIAAVEQEEYGSIVRPMILTRFSAGITRSASVGVGEIIDFDGLEATVIGIRHQHQPYAADKAPCSTVHLKFYKPLFDSEIEVLRTHGWKDC